jgi:hypothetical protein
MTKDEKRMFNAALMDWCRHIWHKAETGFKDEHYYFEGVLTKVETTTFNYNKEGNKVRRIKSAEDLFPFITRKVFHYLEEVNPDITAKLFRDPIALINSAEGEKCCFGVSKRKVPGHEATPYIRLTYRNETIDDSRNLIHPSHYLPHVKDLAKAMIELKTDWRNE